MHIMKLIELCIIFGTQYAIRHVTQKRIKPEARLGVARGSQVDSWANEVLDHL